MAEIDARLLNDCEILGKFKLCHVLLMRDANYPWIILVPDRENKTEIFELSEDDQQQLNFESNILLAFLNKEFNADKMNIAALGNVVSQLHIHHIVRYKTDIAWPAPVWGAFPAKPYREDDLDECIASLVKGFNSLDIGFHSR
ncbi:MAG: HIT domain-containing protein [Gammaproteobacteria bacterium]|nr:HIT domain-containing protein [Gammaproteobacteria bacterium]